MRNHYEVNMNELKQSIINRAIGRYHTVKPVPSARDFTGCFTTDNEKLYFWFNTKDNSTHVLSAPLFGQGA